MALPKKKIAIVGCGFAGLGAIFTLKEEGGFEPVCFERTEKPGGTWCYKEYSIEGVASIMPTTIINHSKEIGAISKFPPRKELNNFMRHEELYQYIMDIANSVDALKHVQCNSEVVEVKKTTDYDETGRWSVKVRNTVTNEVTTDIYDGVMITVGHINRPKMPSYPGQDLFNGTLLHTHSLKGVEPYRNKTVVVVGMGCSALDAAVETSSIAKQVYISTRSGAHVINRVGPQGYPYDYLLLRRCFVHLLDIFPTSFVNWLIEGVYLDAQFNQNMYAVKPNHGFFAKDPVLNDHIGSKLLSGSVIQKPDIKCFTENGIIFEGDNEVTQADVVIMATGYTWKFPFLEEGIIVEEDGKIKLYKCMFPIHLQHATLAVIGFILPFGPGFPLGELQCRWAAQVLAGKSKLPSKEVMLKDIKDRYEANLARYLPGDKMSIRVDFVQYGDDIASQFGVKPNFIKMMVTDPILFLKLVFGPSLSYQYRLQGPHSWAGAREAIMTSKDRMMWPINRNSKDIRDNIFLTCIKKIFRILFH